MDQDSERRRPPYRRHLRELVRRADAMSRGDFEALGQPVGGPPEVEDLRRAIDVLGAHVEQAQQNMHAYIAALTTAQEAERGRLARELHDDTVQQLVALGQGVDRVQRALERSPEQAAERLAGLRVAIGGLVQSLRAIIGDLRPPALEELGLIPALELLLQQRGDDAPAVSIAVEGPQRRLDSQSELALFRIMQEAWSNIRKHARAGRATFAFAYGKDALTVRIGDDGQGFELPGDGHAERGHWGLLGMRERAALVGGTLVLRSAPGAGTTLTVVLPYPGAGGRDPVCGMSVSPADLGAEHAGRLYRFCSAACRDHFQAQPERYLGELSPGGHAAQP